MERSDFVPNFALALFCSFFSPFSSLVKIVEVFFLRCSQCCEVLHEFNFKSVLVG